MLEDYAENRKSQYAEGEVKSAHIGKGQCVLHPVLIFFKDDDAQMVRHVIMYLSDDIEKSHHHVQHFTVDAIDRIKGAAGRIEGLSSSVMATPISIRGRELSQMSVSSLEYPLCKELIMALSMAKEKLMVRLGSSARPFLGQ